MSHPASVLNEQPKNPGNVVQTDAPTGKSTVKAPPADATVASIQALGPLDSLPQYVLKHAPLVWLDKEEEFWPGNVMVHLQNVHAENSKGDKVEIPAEAKAKGGASWLAHPSINKGDVFLAYNTDPRVHTAKKITTLTSPDCKPHGDSRKSNSVSFIVTVDKSKELGAGFVDVFYFYFYPYNFGASVVGIHFGNHIGDWEHTMIRFKNGEPQAMHLSAHSDGHAWKMSCFETIDGRPTIYSARGSHAGYPRAGSQKYSGIIGGPVDYTSRGFLWDPMLNYVSLNYERSRDKFVPHTPWPFPTASPWPSAEDAVNVLAFRGHWGNAFADYRTAKPDSDPITKGISWLKEKVHHDGDEGKAQQAKVNELSVDQKFNKLKWGEGPTGPRDKSLDRKGMNRWTGDITDTI